MSDRKNVGVILAGGIGSRFGGDTPKQFAKVCGKTVIEHTIDIFDECPEIDEIAVVIHPNHIERMESMTVKNNWKKVRKLLSGGKERYDSSLAAINAYEKENNVNLIFHDSVRPLVSHDIIRNVTEALEKYEAIDVAMPATDTIVNVSLDSMTISSIPERRCVYQGQTPQAFRLETIKKAYELALKDENFKTTDDCGVVKKYLPDVPVYVVNGNGVNMKLTHIEDLYMIDKLYQLNSQQINKNVDFSGLKGKVIMAFGGNSGIGLEICKIGEANGAKVYPFSRSTTGTDIGNINDVKAAFEKVHSAEGKIDYVVLSAAILRREAFHSMELSTIDSIIDINYKGMVYVSQIAYPYLKESKGQLLHFTSSSYTLGRPYYSLYSSTKAAVVNFVQALSQEWYDSEIRVNCINPERTLTAMRVANFGKEDANTLLKATDVAEVSVAVLLSDYTGQTIDVRLTDKR